MMMIMMMMTRIEKIVRQPPVSLDPSCAFPEPPLDVCSCPGVWVSIGCVLWCVVWRVVCCRVCRVVLEKGCRVSVLEGGKIGRVRRMYRVRKKGVEGEWIYREDRKGREEE